MDIEPMLSQGEGQQLEFKQSFAVEREIIETLCAFANSEGGVVLVGIRDNGTVIGAHVGGNTLENFANALTRETEPRIYVSMKTQAVDGKKVVAISVRSPRQGELFYAFGTPYLRMGRTNQVMDPVEQKARLLGDQQDWAEERDRPRFDFPAGSFSNRETQFEIGRRVRQVSGDYVAVVEWRFRGPKLQPPMDWRQVSGASFGSYTMAATFDKSVPLGEDDLVPEDQFGIEVRFHWRGKFRHEIHRYQFREWEIGREVLPPLYPDE